jgi:hypothetical protein
MNTLSDLLPLVAVGGFVVTLGTALGKFAMDYLTAKFGRSNGGAEFAARQAEACRFDHQNIHVLLASQNSNIAELLKQNARTLDAMKDHSHVMELRHQILMSKMEKCEADARAEAKLAAEQAKEILARLPRHGD